MTPTEGSPLPSRRALREQQRGTGAVDSPGATAPAPTAPAPTAPAQATPVAIPVASSPMPLQTPPPPVVSTPPARVETTAAPPAAVPQPLTRRQRREHEQQVATGAISLPPDSALQSSFRTEGIAPTPVAPTPVAPTYAAPTEGAAGRAYGQPEPATVGAPPDIASAVAADRDAAHFRLLTRRERREMEQRGEPVPETGRIPVVSDSGATVTAQAGYPAADSGPPLPTGRATAGAEGDLFRAPGVAAVTDTPLPPVFAGPTIVQPDSLTVPARTIGAGLDTTHALILPVAPTVDVTGPMGDTGEVLVTGNIALPRHVSERALTGALEMEEDHSPYDQADGSGFTTPIRATDAVSSRTIQVGQPMIQRPRQGMASIVLGSSAAILGVTALGLLALALLTDIVELPF